MMKAHGITVFLITFLLLSPLYAKEAVEDTKEHANTAATTATAVPVLLYHRFGPVVPDSTTIKTTVFESQLQYLKDNGYTVIPLADLLDYLQGKKQTLPRRSVVITVDDGHKSVYTDMYPLVKKYNVPVTLFIYPSAISNASYAMTWNQLRELKKTGLFDLQSHTYWHPDFKKEKAKLDPSQYDKFVATQFTKSKDTLDKELGGKVNALAWPFGIYDKELMAKAGEAGYVAAFTIEQHHATRSDALLALPRYPLGNASKGAALGALLAGGSPGSQKTESQKPTPEKANPNTPNSNKKDKEVNNER